MLRSLYIQNYALIEKLDISFGAGFSVITGVQTQTPPQLVGKIMATLVAVAMCGQPIGQMVYGILFDVFIQETWVVMFVASIASIMISIYSKRIFQKLEI